MDPLLAKDDRTDILEEDRSSKLHQTPEKHLDSAITISLLLRLQNTVEQAHRETPGFSKVGPCGKRESVLHRYLNRHPLEQFSNLRRHISSYSRCLHYALSEPTILTAHEYPRFFNIQGGTDLTAYQALAQTRTLFTEEVNCYLDHYKDVLKPDSLSRIRTQLLSRSCDETLIANSAAQAKLWSDIVDHYRKTYGIVTRPKKVRFGRIKVITGEGFLFLKEETEDKWWICTYEQLQMIQDAVMARHHVYCALEFGFHNGSYQLPHRVHQVISWQEDVLRTYGNDGYVLVKAPEAVFKTWLTSLTKGDILPYTSYERTIDKIRDKERRFDTMTPLTNTLASFVTTVQDIADAAELFGLTKLSGHPVVYPEKSARAVKDIVKGPKVLSATHIRFVTRTAKHLILSGYLRVHHDWPPFKCPPAFKTDLARHYRNRVTTLPLGCYPLSDLDAVVFAQFIDFDYSDDYLKLLDDKAICPGATEMAKFWFGGEKTESRRLLQKVLTMPHFNTRDLIKSVQLDGFQEEDLVIELTQKEREFKNSARCFAKNTFKMRCLLMLLEHNIKERFLREYIPHQTMTMSHADEKKRLYHLVREASRRNKCLVEGDYSSWNLAMCPQLVNPIAEELNDIFGMPNTFNLMHDFFSLATIVLADKHTLPPGANPSIPVTRWPESDLVWRGHANGLEGLGQGQWSFVTIALCLYCTHDLNVSYNMALQGDNVVFAFEFHDKTIPVAQQLQSLLARIEIRSKWVNHTVKPEECLDSYTVLTYGKEIYVNGAHVLYNLKFASRSFRRDEIDVPSLTKEISGANATAMACADSTLQSILAIKWKFWLVIRILQYRSVTTFYSKEHRALREILGNLELLKFVLLLPGSLGGLPMLPWTRFFMKGELDDLSWDVPAVLSLQQANKPLASDLRHLLRGDHSPHTPDPKQLLLDPTSIPINRPQDMTRLIKDEVASVLPGLTKNRHIWEIISPSSDAPSRILLERLAATKPLYPQIMADIYKLSPAGVRDSIYGRFVMTRTITALTNSTNFMSEIQESNRAMLQSLINRYNTAKREPLNPTRLKPFDCCQKLRSLWKIDLSNACIGVYTPFEFKLGCVASSVARISASTRTTYSHQMLQEAGAYAPNFGTRTRQKVTSHGFKVITSSSTVKDLKALTLIWSELGADSSLARILNDITYARSPWSVETLSEVLPTSFGGSAAHRHQQLDQRFFSVLGSKTVPTHLNFCSDQAGILSGGELDYPIAFQPFYLTLTSHFQFLAAFDVLYGPLELSYVLTDQYHSLPEDPVQSDKGDVKIPWRSLKGNPLSYVSQLQMADVPIIPPRTVIPHVAAPSLPVASLVYSSLLARYSVNTILSLNEGACTLPIDIFDIKEFNHMPLNEILKGAAYYCQCVAIANASTATLRLDAHRLRDGIAHAATGIGSLLSRLLTHPSNIGALLTQSAETRLVPGPFGAISAAQQLIGYLVDLAYRSLQARDAYTQHLRLTFFEGKMKAAPSLAYKHACFLLATAGKTDSIYLTSFEKVRLLNAAFSSVTSANPVFRTQQVMAVYRILCTKRRKGSSHEVDWRRLSIQYCPTSIELAFRARRSKPRDVRVPLPSECRDIDKLTTYRSVRWVESFSVGTAIHDCYCTNTDSEIHSERVLNMIQRPYGVYASAVSTWAAALAPYRKTIHNAHVVAVGVGHGASARVCLEYGATHVTGIDLRTSFPVSAQREGAYIPPEVVESARFMEFDWSYHVAAAGGDILRRGWGRECCGAVVVLDTETGDETHSVLLLEPKEPRVIFHRVFLCDEGLRTYISRWQPSRVLVLSSSPSLRIKTYLAVFEKTVEEMPCNYQAVRVTSSPLPIPAAGNHSPSDVLRVLNRMIRPTGFIAASTHLADLINTESKIKTAVLNSDSQPLSESWNKIRDKLQNLIEYLQDETLFFLSNKWDWPERMYCRIKSLSRTEADLVRERMSNRDI